MWGRDKGCNQCEENQSTSQVQFVPIKCPSLLLAGRPECISGIIPHVDAELRSQIEIHSMPSFCLTSSPTKATRLELIPRSM